MHDQTIIIWHKRFLNFFVFLDVKSKPNAARWNFRRCFLRILIISPITQTIATWRVLQKAHALEEEKKKKFFSRCEIVILTASVKYSSSPSSSSFIRSSSCCNAHLAAKSDRAVRPLLNNFLTIMPLMRDTCLSFFFLYLYVFGYKHLILFSLKKIEVPRRMHAYMQVPSTKMSLMLHTIFFKTPCMPSIVAHIQRK